MTEAGRNKYEYCIILRLWVIVIYAIRYFRAKLWNERYFASNFIEIILLDALLNSRWPLFSSIGNSRKEMFWDYQAEQKDSAWRVNNV